MEKLDSRLVQEARYARAEREMVTDEEMARRYDELVGVELPSARGGGKGGGRRARKKAKKAEQLAAMASEAAREAGADAAEQAVAGQVAKRGFLRPKHVL